MNLAKEMSEASKDPSTKVGAVIVSPEKRFISAGYNGFPQKIKDDDRLHDRERKYEIIIHGEMNAILFAERSLKDCTIYTYPFMPCPRCASVIIQVGITRVVSYNNVPERWKPMMDMAAELFAEANVGLTLYDNE